MITRTAYFQAFVFVLFLPCSSSSAQTDETSFGAEAIRKLSPNVLPDKQREQVKNQAWRKLRARGDAVNRHDVANWRAITTRGQWEQFRDERLGRLRVALGTFPDPPQKLEVRVTKTIPGDGFTIENLVFRTKHNLWVTANLYEPAKPNVVSKPSKKMPGILIAHSHHRPKTQGELQEMGMLWARSGCLVLVIDQVGHGERADHPFQSEQDYKKKDSAYRWWRQDYYYRFDTNVQLELVGESLMGQMAWDLMRGVDLLLAHPGIDRDKIIILGAVAGGGDPAGVTAALDRRITAAVPFNFGGPQPETRFPLPDDADLRFNYLGGAYWESTRNLRRTGVDGFLHWAIVGSIAPRPLVYAHEFAWDKDRDPVWKRLNKIYAFYDATEKIDYTLGRGSVTGSAPEATHCTNIGRHHRQRIHAAFKRWFDIKVSDDGKNSVRLDPDDLRSMSDEARRDLKPKKLFEALTDVGHRKISAARRRLNNKSPAQRRKRLRDDWRKLLGDIQPGQEIKVLSRNSETATGNAVTVERIALQTEPDIVVPMILMVPNAKKPGRSDVVVAVSQAGKKAFLSDRSKEIAELLAGGAVVCLPDLRDVGPSRGSRGDGNGSTSYYALFFETPMLGHRLRDLRAVLQYLRTRDDLKVNQFALWGDSFAPPNAKNTDFQVPWRVNGRPRFSEPVGGLLAMLGGLFEDDIKAIYVHGGLNGYLAVLAQPYVYIPHDVVVPGVLTRGDLADVAASFLPRPIRLDGTVDGLNRTMSAAEVRATYEAAIGTDKSSAKQSLVVTSDRSDTATWLLKSMGRSE